MELRFLSISLKWLSSSRNPLGHLIEPLLLPFLHKRLSTESFLKHGIIKEQNPSTASSSGIQKERALESRQMMGATPAKETIHAGSGAMKYWECSVARSLSTGRNGLCIRKAPHNDLYPSSSWYIFTNYRFCPDSGPRGSSKGFAIQSQRYERWESVSFDEVAERLHIIILIPIKYNKCLFPLNILKVFQDYIWWYGSKFGEKLIKPSGAAVGRMRLCKWFLSPFLPTHLFRKSHLVLFFYLFYLPFLLFVNYLIFLHMYLFSCFHAFPSL